jgi:hypothetical protein
LGLAILGGHRAALMGKGTGEGLLGTGGVT